jgi:acyl dehydratase
MNAHLKLQRPAVPLARAHELLGQTLFVTDWMTVERDRCALFDRSIGATPDEADLAVAAANPLGADLINGCWLLGWLVTVQFNHLPIRESGMWGLQYGFDRVRFAAAVMIGSRIRCSSVLLEVRPHAMGRVLVTRNTVEVAAAGKPAAVIDHLALLSTRATAG